MVSVLTPEIGRDPSFGGFHAAMRSLAGGVSAITAGARRGRRGNDGDLRGVAVHRAAVADCQDQPVVVLAAVREAPPFYRRQYPECRTVRRRRTIHRLGWPEGRRPVRRRRMEARRLGRAAAGRRPGCDRLRGRGGRRAPLACNHHRPRAGHRTVRAPFGVGLLAATISGQRSRRGSGETRGGGSSGRAVSTQASMTQASVSLDGRDGWPRRLAFLPSAV